MPLAGTIVAWIGGAGVARIAGPVTAVLASASAVWLVADVASGGPRTVELAGFAPPLGIALRADGLSALFVATTALVGATVAVGSSGLSGEGRWNEREGFWPAALALWAAMNAVFLSGDAFNLYVGLELVTLAAIALLVLADDEAALGASIRYLIAVLVGALAYLLGISLLYGAYGALDLQVLGERLEPGYTPAVAGGLILAGLGLKTALFPLHGWLAPAHAAARSPASALLSGLVVKSSFYVALRFVVDVYPAAITPAAGAVVGGLGAGAIVWGSVQAIRQDSLKRIVAYSTVAQVGYLFVALALIAGAGDEVQALGGAAYQVISHAGAKAAMFLAAGALIAGARGGGLAGLHGMAARMPVSVAAFGLAGMSLAGLPPSGGFVAKWMLLRSALEDGAWWWAAAVALGGLLAAAYVAIVLRATLAGPEDREVVPVPRIVEGAALGLAVLVIAIGFGATGPLDLLDAESILDGGHP